MLSWGRCWAWTARAYSRASGKRHEDPPRVRPYPAAAFRLYLPQRGNSAQPAKNGLGVLSLVRSLADRLHGDGRGRRWPAFLSHAEAEGAAGAPARGRPVRRDGGHRKAPAGAGKGIV